MDDEIKRIDLGIPRPSKAAPEPSKTVEKLILSYVGGRESTFADMLLRKIGAITNFPKPERGEVLTE